MALKLKPLTHKSHSIQKKKFQLHFAISLLSSALTGSSNLGHDPVWTRLAAISNDGLVYVPVLIPLCSPPFILMFEEPQRPFRCPRKVELISIKMALPSYPICPTPGIVMST